MNKTKTITIFNQKLCGYLMMNGFVLLSMSKNNHCANKNVFFFMDTDELHKAIDEYKKINRY